MLQLSPPDPLMVHCSDSLTKHSNIGDVRKLIHEGKISNLGCLMLPKNHPEVIVDYVKLDEDRFYYLMALRDGFLPIHHGVSFYVEPYSLHQSNRQFGFCQRIRRVIFKDLRF